MKRTAISVDSSSAATQ